MPPADETDRWLLPLDPDVDAEDDVGQWRYGTHGHRTVPVRPSLHRHATTILVVAAGAFVGGIARYGVGVAWPETTSTFPWGTFAVNTLGAFVLGVVVVLAAVRFSASRHLRPLLGTGFCGGLTTFSSAVTGVDRLWSAGHEGVAVGYLVVSVAAGLLTAWAGLRFGLVVAGRRRTAR